MFNNSSVSSTDHLQNTTGPVPTHWTVTVILSLITVITVLANLSVVVSFTLEPRLREPFNYYLLNLAVSDFLTGSCGMSHFVIYTHYNYWPYSYGHCTFWMIFDWLSITAAIITVAVISLDRLWAVTFPTSYYSHNTSRKAVTVIVGVWIIVCASVLPGMLYDRFYNAAHYEAHDCYWDFNGPTVWASPLYVVPITEWIPALTILICYVLTSYKIYQAFRQRSRIQVVILSGHRSQRRAKDAGLWNKERQAFILLTLLTVALVVCWGPWFVYSGWVTYGGLDSLTTLTVTYWIAYSMAMINPFLFNFANPDMRRTVKWLLRAGRVKVDHGSGTATLSLTKPESSGL